MRRRTPRGQAAPRVARTMQRLMLADAPGAAGGPDGARIPPEAPEAASDRETGQCGHVAGLRPDASDCGPSCRCRSAVLGYPVDPIGDAE
jgi:hypothetical protein